MEEIPRRKEKGPDTTWGKLARPADHIVINEDSSEEHRTPKEGFAYRNELKKNNKEQSDT
ncbi:hypothetical protein HZC00_03450 [Candidatus Kaiserbacteria bacterium]|nr:hypothetical protein [Candidatus Kaiserbacteria bacterium]